MIFSLTDFCRFEPKNISDKIGLNRLENPLSYLLSIKSVKICFICVICVLIIVFGRARCVPTQPKNEQHSESFTKKRDPFPSPFS